MSVTATGILSLPLENMRTLVAASEAFQAWVDAENSTAAKTSIHIGAVDESSVSRPFALVMPSGEWSATAVGGTGPYTWLDSGSLYLAFEDDVLSAYDDDYDDSLLTFLNAVGGVLGDLLSTAGTDAYLCVRNIELEFGPELLDPRAATSRDRVIAMAFAVDWGLSSG